MDARTSRRATIAGFAALAAGMTGVTVSRASLAQFGAISSAGGIVAGGSLDGAGGAIQFSAFGSRITVADSEEPVLFCALTWFDPAGLDGGPLTIDFATVDSYGPTDVDNERLMTGTVTLSNGDDDVPYALRLVDGGAAGESVDSVHFVVGDGAAATPAASGTSGFAYEVSGDLTSGNIQIITFPPE